MIARNLANPKLAMWDQQALQTTISRSAAFRSRPFRRLSCFTAKSINSKPIVIINVSITVLPQYCIAEKKSKTTRPCVMAGRQERRGEGWGGQGGHKFSALIAASWLRRDATCLDFVLISETQTRNAHLCKILARQVLCHGILPVNQPLKLRQKRFHRTSHEGQLDGA